MTLLIGKGASQKVDFRCVRSVLIASVEDVRCFIEQYNKSSLREAVYVRVTEQSDLVFSSLLKFIEENPLLRLTFVVAEDGIPGTFLSRMVRVVKDEGDVKPQHVLFRVAVPRSSKERIYDIFGILNYEKEDEGEGMSYAGV